MLSLMKLAKPSFQNLKELKRISQSMDPWHTTNQFTLELNTQLPCLQQPPAEENVTLLALTKSEIGNKCQSHNIVHAVMETSSATNFHPKYMLGTTKDQTIMSNNLNDDCIQNQNQNQNQSRIFLQRHSNNKALHIMDIAKNRGLAIRESEV
ncbi:hypothetical protein VNO78_09283 [Psophocarpus tetragonolobus]|uniref:Uncharacterized protein n=1 Tax=Psophocarpus tetragonolobus TaxID=3891 RepID=A0AAN9SW68_PSOTE